MGDKITICRNYFRAVLLFTALSISFSCNSFKQGWEAVDRNLYLFRDCANVYALVDGHKACLIGFATGKAMDQLQEIGVDKVDLVLVTHHHREGLQGIDRAVKAGIDIVIPIKESPFIEFAENHWQKKRIFNNYEGKSRFNTVSFNVPVTRKVKDGDIIEWGSYKFRVLEIPGHTDGSVAYFVDFNGKKVAFTGDFYTSPGKTLTYHDLHWAYGSGPGLSQSISSAEILRSAAPMLVCPEHGSPFEEKGDGLDRLAVNLKNLYEALRPNRKRGLNRKPLDAVSPHLVFIDEYVTYGIISDTKHAIIYDPGYCRREIFQEFVKKYGIKSVDAITFSHYHDDHIARTLEYLYRWQGGVVGPLGTEIWVFETMADVFAHPKRYNIPCLFPVPIKPDRIIADGEVVEWEGLKLTFKHFPGQTWYHTVVLFEADGHRYALTGDSVSEPADWSVRMNGPVIPRNRYFLGKGYESVFQTLIDYNVDMIVPAHYDPFPVTQADLQRSLKWAKSIAPMIAELVDQPHPGYGLDPIWAHFYPYRVEVKLLESTPVNTVKVSLMVQNYFDHAVPLEVTLILPPGIKARPDKERVILPAESETPVDFQLEIEPESNGKRRVLFADITLDGRYLGQVTEMVIDTPIKLPETTLK